MNLSLFHYKHLQHTQLKKRRFFLLKYDMQFQYIFLSATIPAVVREKTIIAHLKSKFMDGF